MRAISLSCQWWNAAFCSARFDRQSLWPCATSKARSRSLPLKACFHLALRTRSLSSRPTDERLKFIPPPVDAGESSCYMLNSVPILEMKFFSQIFLRKLAENSPGTCTRDESACYPVPAARCAGRHHYYMCIINALFLLYLCLFCGILYT